MPRLTPVEALRLELVAIRRARDGAALGTGEAVDAVFAGAQLEIGIEHQTTVAPLDVVAPQGRGVPLLDLQAAIGQARMAKADAAGCGADDALLPDLGIRQRARRQPRWRRDERSALRQKPIELGARQVIAVHRDRPDLLHGAQVAQGIGAGQEQIGTLAGAKRARAIAEEAPDFTGGAA